MLKMLKHQFEPILQATYFLRLSALKVLAPANQTNTMFLDFNIMALFKGSAFCLLVLCFC